MATFKEPFVYVKTKLDIREFDPKPVPKDIIVKILDAARFTGSGKNLQHWRFIVVEDRENLRKLAEDSTTGYWVRDASFAVIVLTDPRYAFHLIDAGRVVQSMQIVAWSYGIVSCIFTGMKINDVKRDFKIPEHLNPSVIIGFGYPKRKIIGKKNRLPLEELVFKEYYGNRFL